MSAEALCATGTARCTCRRAVHGVPCSVVYLTDGMRALVHMALQWTFEQTLLGYSAGSECQNEPVYGAKGLWLPVLSVKLVKKGDTSVS
jgi:hypothetical protein